MDTELLRTVVDAGHANLGPGQAQSPDTVARDVLDRISELTIEHSGDWLFRTGESMAKIATSTVYGH
jgi:hypothetical protein